MMDHSKNQDHINFQLPFYSTFILLIANSLFIEKKIL